MMKKSELHRQLLDILSDQNLDVDAQAVSIEALFEQYLSSHDNKLLNSLSDVFDRSQRNLG